MIIDDQSDVRRFLENQTGPSEQTPQQIETHISYVYIYADRVFKLKKAVKLPYLDFSTLQARIHYCQQELALNRRTAPQLYRAVHTIVRRSDGTLALDGDGETVDAIVEMARFEQDFLLDNLARNGRLERSTMDQLAQQIAGFHLSLPSIHLTFGSNAVAMVQSSNEESFAATIFSKDENVVDLLAKSRAQIDRFASVLDDRSSEGYLRRCHGDLHLRNICLIDGVPTLFDCLEFDERLAEIDVLYDLAFLLMDLWQHELPDAANQVFNRYLDKTGDIAALCVMPLFMALRATIRGHVAATQLTSGNSKAGMGDALANQTKSYIELARTLLQSKPPRLIAIAGLSGSGKSTAAAAIAPSTGSPPGARILSTDRIRKDIFGVDPLEKLPAEAYAPDVSVQVYDRQRAEALKALKGGWSVIADGVFLQSHERTAIEDVARQAGVSFKGFWLQAPQDELLARVESRRNDPSDATADVVRLQAGVAVDPAGWAIINANQPMDQCAKDIRRELAKNK